MCTTVSNKILCNENISNSCALVLGMYTIGRLCVAYDRIMQNEYASHGRQPSHMSDSNCPCLLVGFYCQHVCEKSTYIQFSAQNHDTLKDLFFKRINIQVYVDIIINNIQYNYEMSNCIFLESLNCHLPCYQLIQ